MKLWEKTKARVRAYLELHGRATAHRLARFLKVQPEIAYEYLMRLCAEKVAYRTRSARLGLMNSVIFHAGRKPVVMASLPGRVFRDGVRA